jgi:hypothetical protein
LTHDFSRSTRLAGFAALVLALGAAPAHAQDTPIKFQLDWRFEGPAALFLVPVAKGYFKSTPRTPPCGARPPRGSSKVAEAHFRPPI